MRPDPCQRTAASERPGASPTGYDGCRREAGSGSAMPTSLPAPAVRPQLRRDGRIWCQSRLALRQLAVRWRLVAVIAVPI